MPVATPCPPASRLRDLALGFVREHDISDLELHVLACDACVAAMANLTDSDRLADAMRQVASARVPHGDDVNCAIERACRLGADAKVAGSGDTADSIDETDLPQPAAPPDLARLIAQVLSPPKATNELGWLGPYRVLQLIGHGGMGLLFLAEDGQLRRRVALKVMQPRLAAAADARGRFLREARAAAALKHDNIVTVYHVGEDRGVFWLAMELLEGEPLDRRLKQQGPLDILEATQIGRQVAEALAAAHAHRVIHRDIKPANIWLEAPRQRAKVLDFGLARAAHDEAELTQSGDIVGTPAYMSPEQARGDAVDHRSDLFSLGCVLYCMLVGKTPFAGKSTMATLSALATQTPSPVRDLVPNVPAALNELITKLLLKEPADRPQSAAEVVRTLTKIEATLIPGASPPAPPICNPSVPSPPPLPIASRSRFSFPPSRIAIALASALLGSAILAAILLQIKTPAGTIVIEIDQPEAIGAVVTVDDKEHVTIKTADHQDPIRVVADEKQHNLKVEKGGFETFTREFTVKAGKVQTIRVRLQPQLAAANSKNSENKRAAASTSPVTTAAALDFRSRLGKTPTHVQLGRITVGDPLTVELYATSHSVEQRRVPLWKHDGAYSLYLNQEGKHWNWVWFDFALGKGGHIAGPLVTTEKRTHLAGVSTGSDLLFFVDGKLQGKQRITSELKRQKVTTTFGSHLIDHEPWNGTIDEARISKTARYDSDFVPPPLNFESDRDTIALYHFDEGQGSVLKDSSGSGQDGMIFNPRWVPRITGEVAGVKNTQEPRSSARINQWVPLFNGKDLTNWEMRSGGQPWVVQNGQLVGDGSTQAVSAMLKTVRSDFTNFHLRIEAMTSSDQSWITVRVPDEGVYFYRVGLQDGELTARVSASGDLAGLMPVDPDSDIKFGEWFTQDVIANDDKITILVNGKQLGVFQDKERLALIGAIGFSRRRDTTVRIRKIEIMELP